MLNIADIIARFVLSLQTWISQIIPAKKIKTIDQKLKGLDPNAVELFKIVIIENPMKIGPIYIHIELYNSLIVLERLLNRIDNIFVTPMRMVCWRNHIIGFLMFQILFENFPKSKV